MITQNNHQLILLILLLFLFERVGGLFGSYANVSESELALEGFGSDRDERRTDAEKLLVHRSKRQWGCPNGCFSPCMNSAQCQRYQLATVCVLGCCCPAQSAQTNLTSACDGDPAVAACLNGLCGQGYFCNSRNFCCRCQSGTSPGPCVNNLCPPGYACNTNNFCCSLGSGSVLGPCVNGQCPSGYACGAGNLCYPVTGNGGNVLGG
uniref:Uncharacterized protein n=1 Tax=Globodera rostochiensis TaxID=31243 RepID=A0A914HIL9_GLORO